MPAPIAAAPAAAIPLWDSLRVSSDDTTTLLANKIPNIMTSKNNTKQNIKSYLR